MKTAKDITRRLEEMSDLLLTGKRESCWAAASLLAWEAAKHIKELRERQRSPDIYVSALDSPDE